MRVQPSLPEPIDVLIAEDDPPARTALRLLLETQGYRCAEAANGRQAVELAMDRPPQCVMLDLAMPELDGFAVARHLRAHPRTTGVHINCLTGLADDGAREQARQAGCETFFTKPVDAARLLEAVRRQVESPAAAQVTGLTKAQAEDMLDWLENHGCTGLEVSVTEEGFAVRCFCPPGLRLSREEGGDIRLSRS
jgi:CheY-like chemotaxis protein